MKFVIAPDSFKGSLSALEVCAAVAQGIRRVLPDADIVSIPMADGGEGTVEALVASTAGTIERVKVTGPLGKTVDSFYGILGNKGSSGKSKTAVIEMAAAAGLPLVPQEKRNPLHTTTYGLGELIRHGLDSGCREFLIGIGGSATNDCGTGMAQALGTQFFDVDGNEITQPMTGRINGDIKMVDVSKLDDRIKQSRFVVACDVTNPLLGANGASRTYGPQKGADSQTVDFLEKNTEHIIGLIEQATNSSVCNVPGTGAAGGLGAALMAFCEASLRRGIELVMEACRFEDRIRGADLLITGEGKIDATTAHGKTIAGITHTTSKQHIPVIALAGIVDPAINLRRLNLQQAIPICTGSITTEYAIANAAQLLANAAEQIVKNG